MTAPIPRRTALRMGFALPGMAAAAGAARKLRLEVPERIGAAAAE